MDIYIKNQLIRGIASDTLQADLLAKTGMLKSLQENVCQMGITAMGEAQSILKQAKEPSTQTIYAKTPSAKLPLFHFEMTLQQFKKFQINWEVFTRITNMPTSQTNIQLYSCANDSIQNAIINT